MLKRVFIHATNIHQGGGKLLLATLMDACANGLKVIAQFDKRMNLPLSSISENITIKYVEPFVHQRLHAEWWLRQNVRAQDIVLCFGNLPPLFKLRGHVIVFVQNRYLVNQKKLEGFSFKTRLRIQMERLWLSKIAHHADEFIVQTPSMRADLLSSGCVVTQPVHIRPFTDILGGYQRTRPYGETSPEHKQYDFVYVASGDPHKNHRRLIEAWCLLAQQGIFPSLCLTLDEKQFGALWNWINKLKLDFGLKLENLDSISHGQVLWLYTQTHALIYPSTFESFGLPLIEARQAGLPILASELDYVRDILDPEQTFNPESPASIARAVKRFMRIDEKPLPLLNAKDFIQRILEKT